MKNIGIYPRILLTLTLTGIIFVFLLSALYFITNQQEKSMIEASRMQFNNEVNSLITLKKATLDQAAYNYTNWDDFVENLNSNNTNWYDNNITTILNFFHADYVCVFDTSFAMLHEASSKDFVSRDFISKDVLIKLKDARFLSYFQVSSDSLMEISSATIFPNMDSSSTLAKPSGYLFLVKSWNRGFLDEFEIQSGAKISFLMPSNSIVENDGYSISTVKKLTDWKGENVAQIVFTRTSDSIKFFHGITVYMFILILGLVIAIWIIFQFTTRKWIIKPLKLVTKILESGDGLLAKKLEQYPGEYKNIGYLFSGFIIQKDKLRLAKERAEENDRLKSAFLSNMSHEIRTPMNGILGFAGLLKEPALTSDEKQEYINIIEQSGTRLLNIINDILSISKMESGQSKISMVETNVNDQIEYIYAFFKPEAENKGIQFSFKNPLPKIESGIITDKEKVYAILTNLVKNAIKFTNAGSIEFGYVKKGKYLEFFVKDTGMGIRPEQKKDIFERFRQGSELHTHNYEGSGLGLSISKDYVEMLGGKIWLESEEGKGSVFYFTLPYKTEVEEKTVLKMVELEDSTDNQSKSLKILIAEDDETSTMLLAKRVMIFSKEILNARTGVEAVEICRNNPDIDLVLMDIKMPEMDGYEATSQIRQFNKKVIIIAQTAFGLPRDRDKAIEAGCNDYIYKPINPFFLIKLIKKYFFK